MTPVPVTDEEIKTVIELYRAMEKMERNIWIRDGNTLYTSMIMHQQDEKELVQQ